MAFLLAGVIGPIVLMLTDNISALLDPGYNLDVKPMSYLALSSIGWLARAGFYVFGLLLIMLVLGLVQNIRRRRGFGTSITLLIAIGFGFILVGTFNTDPQGINTMHGLIHSVAAKIMTLLFPLALFLILPSLRAETGWKGFYTYTLITAVPATLLELGRIPMPAHWTWFGLYERVIVWNGLVWLEIMAIRLWRVTRVERLDVKASLRTTISDAHGQNL